MEAVLGEGKTRTRAESNQESSSSIEDDETECSSEPSALKEEQSYPSSQTTEDDNVCVHGKPFASSFVSKRKMEAAMLGEVNTRTRPESDEESSSSSSSILDDETECRSEPSALKEEQCNPSSSTIEDDNVCVHGKPFASSFVSKRKMEAAMLGEGKTRTRPESDEESSSSSTSIQDDETECRSEPSALKEEQYHPSSPTTEDDNVHGKSFGSSFVSMLGEVKTRTRAESNQESSSSSIQDDDTECRSEPSASQEEQCHPSSPTTEDESPVLSIPSLASTESGDTTSSPTSTNTIDSCSSKEHSCHEEPPRLWEAEDGLPANRFQNHSKRLFKSHSLPRRSKGVDVEFFVPPINQHHALLKKQKKKTKRERKTAVGAVGGMVGGFFVLGPFGVILGAAMGGYVTRKVAKKAEKWSQRRKEQESVQNYATSKSLQWKFNDDSVMLT